MGLGLISPTLPFIKKKSIELLKANYSSNEEASRKIPEALTRFYQQSYPDLFSQRSSAISSAEAEVTAIYNRNVFPDLKVTWGTYPNNLGHTDFPGCFRCHDGSHSTSDQKLTITQDCSTCHEPLAIEEASPGVLKTMGLAERIASLQTK
jgi:formate-dependent nitrite reductase cytochrome c552 subunit